MPETRSGTHRFANLTAESEQTSRTLDSLPLPRLGSSCKQWSRIVSALCTCRSMLSDDDCRGKRFNLTSQEIDSAPREIQALSRAPREKSFVPGWTAEAFRGASCGFTCSFWRVEDGSYFPQGMLSLLSFWSPLAFHVSSCSNPRTKAGSNS